MQSLYSLYPNARMSYATSRTLCVVMVIISTFMLNSDFFLNDGRNKIMWVNGNNVLFT